LLEYYAGEGQADPLLIEVPKGSYRVLIHHRNAVYQPAPVPPSPQLPTPKPRSLALVRLRYRWVVPLAFLIGAFVGHRVSR